MSEQIEDDDKCIDCKEPFEFGVNIFTDAGFLEVAISGLCEKCFDSYFENDDPHTCPYKEDIHGDFESMCNCTSEEMQECFNDI